MSTMTYLRCAKDHPNAIPLAARDTSIGMACTVCGAPLAANPPSERRPPRRF